MIEPGIPGLNSHREMKGNATSPYMLIIDDLNCKANKELGCLDQHPVGN